MNVSIWGEGRSAVKARLVLAISILLLAFPSSVWAIPGDTLWTRLYGGYGNEMAYSIDQALDGGYLMAGWTVSFGNGGADFYLVRTDAQGVTLWTRTYGGSDDEIATSMKATPDGGAIIAGWTKSFGAGGSGFYLVKTDQNGETLWTNTFGGAFEDTAKCVICTSDGGYTLCGSSNSLSGGDQSDVYVVKTDSLGQFEWDHHSGGIVDDGAASISQTRDGGYILAGRTGNSDGNHNIYLEKLTSSGSTAWARAYTPGVDNQASSVIEATDGGFVVAGYAYNNPTYLDYLLMKVTSSGSPSWTHTYGTSKWEVAYDVKQTPDHGFVIAGSKWVTLFPDTTQVGIVRTDSTGQMCWSYTYPIRTYDEGTSVTLTEDGNYALVGYACYGYPSSCDMCLLKIEGEWNTPVSDDNNSISEEFSLCDNYPNPFNTQTAIRYNLPNASNVTLLILDIMGRKIETLVSGQQNAGTHEITWDASSLSSGIYFYRIQAGDFILIKRATLLK
jgi:hypothetical protein